MGAVWSQRVQQREREREPGPDSPVTSGHSAGVGPGLSLLVDSGGDGPTAALTAWSLVRH